MEETVKSEVEALRKDFKQIKEDLVGLSQAIKHLSAGYAAEGVDELKQARDKVEAKLRQATAEARGTLEEQVREKPLGTLLIAFAVGLVLGKSLRG